MQTMARFRWQGQEAFWESLSAGCRFTDKGARPHLMIYAGKSAFCLLLPVRPGAQLEENLQTKLDLPRSSGRCAHHTCSRRRRNFCRGRLWGWAGTEDDRVRGGEVGVVKDVEELSTKLRVNPLMDGRVLDQGEIQFRQAGTGERVAADISKCARVGCGEGSGIKPLGHCFGIERAVKTGSQVRAHRVARVSVASR